MKGRRVTAIIALAVVWVSYALLAITFADQAATRCHEFGNLAGECFAPQLLFLAVVTAVFIVATLALTYVATLVSKAPNKESAK